MSALPRLSSSRPHVKVSLFRLTSAAARRRASEKKKGDNMYQYKLVVGGFCATMAAAGLYTFLNPQTSFATMPIIDETAMLVHNGQGHQFTQASNDFF